MDKYKKKTKEKINVKKIVIPITILLLIIALLAILAFMVYNHLKGSDEQVIIPGTVQLSSVNGRLANYIKGLGDSYYIRYTGEFGKTGLNEGLVQATVEYTKRGIETAIVSKEINMQVVTDGEYVYNVADKLKTILKAKLPILFETEEYNLISDFGQQYVADVKTVVADVEYIYQEYEYEGVKIRYYFVGEDLRYIRILTADKDRKINIRVDRHTKNSLFELPEGYNTQII